MIIIIDFKKTRLIHKMFLYYGCKMEKHSKGQKNMKTIIKIVAVVALISPVVYATANTAACAGCHGENFEKSALGKSKIVKDMSKADIVKALKGYKDGSYGGSMKGMMKGQVAKLSDADIKEMAEKIGK
jgi:cytochrome c-type protein NapB